MKDISNNTSLHLYEFANERLYYLIKKLFIIAINFTLNYVKKLR